MSLQDTELSPRSSTSSVSSSAVHTSPPKSSNEAAFYELVNAIRQTVKARPSLHFTVSLTGEESQFTRFNRAKVRQTGYVCDGRIRLTLMAESCTQPTRQDVNQNVNQGVSKATDTKVEEEGRKKARKVENDRRTAAITLPFTGSFAEDWALLQPALTNLQRELPLLPVDPYCVLPGVPPGILQKALAEAPTEASTDKSSIISRGSVQPDTQTREIFRNVSSDRLLSGSALAYKVLSPVRSLDFAGLYAGGISYRAYADSEGKRHWFEAPTFTLDYSLFGDRPNQAVKSTIAGRRWQQDSYTKSVAAAEQQLALLSRPVRHVPKGTYRTYLAPAAVADLMDTLVWGGGLGESALRQGNSAFGKLESGEAMLSKLFSLEENFKRVGIPRFNSSGEIAPVRLPIIQSGRWVNSLINSRSAKEYNKISNGANKQEAMRAPAVAPGTLKETEILAQLGTGLYLSNLHYLNWSDLSAGRVTGMTRYACFWVEEGEIVAPIDNLRFDDDLYRFLGEGLLGLGDRQTFVPSVGTYNQRSLGGMWVPGMLIDQFRYTL